MKRDLNALNNIKEKLTALKGNKLYFKINRGRKRIEDMQGSIENLYPSVFTIKTAENKPLQTFSYFDVLCGIVQFEDSAETIKVVGIESTKTI